jgi:UDP-N-acetylglucosamine acyltransferase
VPIASSAHVHPTAIISTEASIGEGVQIAPYVVIEGPVEIGANTRIRPHAFLTGRVKIGTGNDIGQGVIIGERPQHLGDRGDDTTVEIGDGNTFREYVTIHRGTKASTTTKIGNHNFLMVNCHIGHDSVIGNHCMIVNGSLIAGHCILQDRVLVSGNSAIHQFTRIGRLAMLSGQSAGTKDIPPFVTVYGRDKIAGINAIGMRRAGLRVEEISAVRKAFRILYREKLMLQNAVEKLERELGHYPVVKEMIQFIRESKRGVCGSQFYEKNSEAEAA